MKRERGGRQKHARWRRLRAGVSYLIEGVVYLLRERGLIGEQRQRQAEARRGLLLHHVQRIAGSVLVLFQDPLLDLRAAIGEDDLEKLVFDRGIRLLGGHDCRLVCWICTRLRGRGRCGRAGCERTGCVLCLRKLRLGLRRRRRRGLGLEKELIADEYDHQQYSKADGGAHVAAAAGAAAGALPLNIGIANFCQKLLPCRLTPVHRHSMQTAGAAALPMVMVRGGAGPAHAAREVCGEAHCPGRRG